MQAGTLYIVATPIGNLGDITARALEVLGSVDVIAAEDTRRSGKLLKHFGIDAPLLSCHDHNEARVSGGLLDRLQKGESVALVSDAGTPLISDPGFNLVRAARDADIPVVPVPGPSALVCALSVAGLPTDRFRFEGFPARKPAARRAAFMALRAETTTLVFYESSHRIRETVGDMADVLGDSRQAVIARELTKTYEQIHRASLGELRDWLAADEDHVRGEFVVVVSGAADDPDDPCDAEAERVMDLLLAELPASRAAALAAKITGCPKRWFYDRVRNRGERPD